MLRFKNFNKLYGTYPALKIDGLQLEKGIYWIKGVNGSGKSTLLKSVAGILSFDGNILLGDSISIKKNPVTYRKLINFAGAEPVFPEFLTGNEMIALFARAKDAPAEQQEYYINSMDMQSFTGRPIGTYSSGMLKKLSLLLAFLGKPRFILLDEPLITIDAPSLGILNTWIAELYKQEGTGFLLSSHQVLEHGALPVTYELLVQDQTIKFMS